MATLKSENKNLTVKISSQKSKHLKKIKTSFFTSFFQQNTSVAIDYHHKSQPHYLITSFSISMNKLCIDLSSGQGF